MNLQQFIANIEDIAKVRGVGLLSAITIDVQKPLTNEVFFTIVSYQEPGVLSPINTTWVVYDPTSPYYLQALKLKSPSAPGAVGNTVVGRITTEGYSKTWVVVNSYSEVFSEVQYYVSDSVLLQGGPGATGPQGPVGPQGVQGIQGPAGSIGTQGITGPQGPQGPAGSQGDVGPQGITGDTGPTGPQGIQGPTGPQGIQGPAGITGNDGVSNVPGPAGPQGPAGSTGATGATGPGSPSINLLVNATCYGTVATLIGSIYLLAGTYTGVKASLGSINGVDGTILDIQTSPDATLLTTVAHFGGVGWENALSGFTLSVDTTIDLTLRTTTTLGTGFIHGVSLVKSS